MSGEVVALAGGILFVLVAIVGGGFTIRELVMPKVPHWARVAAGVFGLPRCCRSRCSPAGRSPPSTW